MGFIANNAPFLPIEKIGKIDVKEHYSLAAIPKDTAHKALKALAKQKIKGKSVVISLVKD